MRGTEQCNMKRTNRLTNFIAFLLFAAFVIYAGAYAVRSLRNTTVTAEAVAAELRPGGVASGIVIREESVLTSAEKYIDITARDGAKVAAGAPLATAMRSEAGLDRANRIHSLERDIARVSASLAELDSAEDLTSRDEALRSAVDGLTAAVARHELSSMDGDVLNLRSLLFPGSAVGATKAELRELERELKSLQDRAGDDTKVLSADIGGIFSTLVDGYEELSPSVLSDLTPSQLSDLMDIDPSIPSNAFGKLVSSYRWYFAAAMSATDAENLTVGRTATLNFGRYYGADIRASVISVSEPEDGTAAVVFRCDTALSDTLAMRCVSADVFFAEYSGIRIPAPALHTDPETGETFVWCITATVLEQKTVSVLYQDEDFAIIARSATANALREGNTVVVSGEDLFEGKVVE